MRSFHTTPGMGPKSESKYEKYISIDYSKFTRIGADLENTPEQQVAFLKLNVCENYYIIIYLLLEA